MAIFLVSPLRSLRFSPSGQLGGRGVRLLRGKTARCGNRGAFDWTSRTDRTCRRRTKDDRSGRVEKGVADRRRLRLAEKKTISRKSLLAKTAFLSAYGRWLGMPKGFSGDPTTGKFSPSCRFYTQSLPNCASTTIRATDIVVASFLVAITAFPSTSFAPSPRERCHR